MKKKNVVKVALRKKRKHFMEENIVNLCLMKYLFQKIDLKIKKKSIKMIKYL